MPDKQLDFFNIFDEVSKNPRKVSSAKNEEKTEENKEKPDREAEEKAKLELSKKQIEKQLEEKKEFRNNFLKILSEGRLNIILIEDFEEFLPEIRAYAKRIASFKEEYDKRDGTNKSEIYNKLVWPDSYDNPKYREIAFLYVNYVKIKQRSAAITAQIKKERVKNELKFSNKPGADIDIKTQDKSQKSRVKNKDEISNDIDEAYDDDGAPDPYGDIYPYSRELRKKR